MRLRDSAARAPLRRLLESPSLTSQERDHPRLRSHKQQRRGQRTAAFDRAVVDALATREVGQAVTPPGTPREWTAWLAEAIVDNGSLDARSLDRIPAVVTGSVVTIAETGTIVLYGSDLCGRRAMTLIPDTHVCVVRVTHVIHTVPEGLQRLDPNAHAPSSAAHPPPATSSSTKSKASTAPAPSPSYSKGPTVRDR